MGNFLKEKLYLIAKKWKAKRRKQKILNGEICVDKIMLGKSAVQKGKLLENFVVDSLRNSGVDPHARRTKGSGGYLERGDIYNSLGLNIECKNQKTLQLKSFWAQAEKDAEMAHAEPLLIWHPPNVPLENSVVIMNIDYFVEISKKAQEPKTLTTVNKSDGWKIRRAIQALKELLSTIEK